MLDWDNWHSFYVFRKGVRRRACSEGDAGSNVRAGQIYRTAKTDCMGVAVRLFLAAFVQRAWGIGEPDMSQSALVDWMTQEGYPIKLSSIKNANRIKLQERVVPATDDIVKFLNVLLQRFPALEVHRFVLETI